MFGPIIKIWAHPCVTMFLTTMLIWALFSPLMSTSCFCINHWLQQKLSPMFEILAEYIPIPNTPYYLRSTLPISTPRLDQSFRMDMHVYQQCLNEADVQYEMLDIVTNLMMNQLWYLAKSLFIFVFFDKNVSETRIKELVNKLLVSPLPTKFNSKSFYLYHV